MTEQEPAQEQAQTTDNKQEPTPTPVTPDEVIKPAISEELIKDLNKSINELKEVEKNLFEQQKNFAIKGASDNEDEQLTY